VLKLYMHVMMSHWQTPQLLGCLEDECFRQSTKLGSFEGIPYWQEGHWTSCKRYFWWHSQQNSFNPSFKDQRQAVYMYLNRKRHKLLCQLRVICL